MLISQPSTCLSELQSDQPDSQVPVLQEPPEQARETWNAEHIVPQPPQLFTSVPVLVSHPSVRLLLLQSAKPLAQMPASRSRVVPDVASTL